MSKIQWTEKTWNPIRGCLRVSEGCRNCYAMRTARRQDKPGKAYEGLTKYRDTAWRHDSEGNLVGTYHGVDWSGEVRFVPERLGLPLRWRKPRMVFVNSMGDLFHEKVSVDDIAEVFGVMAVAAKRFYGAKVGGPQNGPHTFQVLTKRPRRMALLVGSSSFRFKVGRAAYRHAHDRTDAGWLYQCITGDREPGNHRTLDKMWPLPNVWLGVSAENQAAADERIPLLLQVPAAVRFVSVEPLLDAVDLSPWLYCQACGYGREAQLMHGDHRLCGAGVDRPGPTVLDWVIAGCESGHGARPAETDWFRSLRDQCQEAGVPFFLKQMMVPGYPGTSEGKLVKMPTLDGKVWDEVPG
jgi:protein gp37